MRGEVLREEGQGGRGVNENKNKKIKEDILQAEAGLLRQTMLIEESREATFNAKHRITHCQSHAGVKENSLGPLN